MRRCGAIGWVLVSPADGGAGRPGIAEPRRRSHRIDRHRLDSFVIRLARLGDSHHCKLRLTNLASECQKISITFRKRLTFATSYAKCRARNRLHNTRRSARDDGESPRIRGALGVPVSIGPPRVDHDRVCLRHERFLDTTGVEHHPRRVGGAGEPRARVVANPSGRRAERGGRPRRDVSAPEWMDAAFHRPRFAGHGDPSLAREGRAGRTDR